MKPLKKNLDEKMLNKKMLVKTFWNKNCENLKKKFWDKNFRKNRLEKKIWIILFQNKNIDSKSL